MQLQSNEDIHYLAFVLSVKHKFKGNNQDFAIAIRQQNRKLFIQTLLGFCPKGIINVLGKIKIRSQLPKPIIYQMIIELLPSSRCRWWF